MKPLRSAECSTHGRWAAINTLSPIRLGRAWLLRLVLWFGRHSRGVMLTRLVGMRVILLARWTLLPDARRPRMLLFETNWSGAEQTYIPDFAVLMPMQWRAIWGNTRRFPGPLPTGELLRHVESVDWGTDHYWSDYEDGSSTQSILRALHVHGQLARFVRSTSGQSAGSFAGSWDRFCAQVLTAPPRPVRWAPAGGAPGASEVAILSPIRDGHGERLRVQLRELGSGEHGAKGAPFAGLHRGTHFARLVVLELGTPHLLFSARFDGSALDYAKALAAVPAARAIWARCARPVRLDADAPTEQELAAYLAFDESARVPASYVVSALGGDVSVAQVNGALCCLRELLRFAEHANHLDAAGTAHVFRQLSCVRELTR